MVLITEKLNSFRFAGSRNLTNVVSLFIVNLSSLGDKGAARSSKLSSHPVLATSSRGGPFPVVSTEVPELSLADLIGLVWTGAYL